jgi:enterobacterial common antigen flippase
MQPQGRPEVAEAAATPDQQHSDDQILKSSALIGFSTVVNLAIGIVRTKAMAVWLGPAGFGLMGLYSSIADLAQSIAGMGINASGVRQIAEAVGTGDTERIARAAVVLRRTAVLLGVLGALLLIAFSRQISTLTFGSDQHAIAVKLLSATVFFSCLSSGQGR